MCSSNSPIDVLSLNIIISFVMDFPSPSTLCERCKMLELDDSLIGHESSIDAGTPYLLFNENECPFLDYEFEDSLPELPLLSQSALRGCEFCSILYKAVRECKFEEQKLHIAFQYRHDFESLVALVAYLSLISHEEESYAYLMFTIDGTAGRCSDWLRLQTPPEDDVMCRKNLERLFKSLDVVTVEEMQTVEAKSHPYLPSRLINVETQAIFDCQLAIIDKKTFPVYPRYSALSYCWGTEKDAEAQFKTERSTIAMRVSGFTLDETSPVIQDAIMVTKALGIPYLWVDALCIVQDDQEDWEKESAEMALIYQNAYVTICAAASDSCHQYFLKKEQTAARVNFQSKIDSNVFGAYNIRWHSEIEAPYLADHGHISYDLSDSCWSNRGWTFQEFMLSRRAIIFGKQKLHFLSNSIGWTENEMTRNPYLFISYDSSSFRKLDCEMLSGWMYAISKYSSRKLSKCLDTLPAVSGLAALASYDDPEKYLAGIRKDYIHRDLIWVIDGGRDWLPNDDKPKRGSILKLLQSPNPYIAPSWSWASRRQELYLYPDVGYEMFGTWRLWNIKRECEILKAKVSLTGLNPFGQVSSGSFTYSGIILPLSRPLGLADGPRMNKRTYADAEFAARVWLDWCPDGDDESIENLSFMLLGSCERLDISGPDSSESELSLLNASESVSSNEKTSTEIQERESSIDLNFDDTSRGDYNEYPKEVAEISHQSLESEGDTDQDDINSNPGGKETGRIAYGLIIHPAGHDGQVLRVGIWTFQSDQSLSYFQNREKTTVEVI